MTRSSHLLGPVALALAGIALLCAMDAVVKLLALKETVIMATLMRAAAGTLITVPLAVALKTPLPGPAGLRIHAARGAMMALMAFLFFYALSILSMAETITLAFIAPLIVPPLAALLLGEPMRGRAALAGVLGFIGVLVTVQGAPAGTAADERWLAIAAVLASAVLYALGNVILRHRAQRDHALAITMLGALVPFLCLAPFALAAAPLPAPESLPIGVLAGLLGTGGALCLSHAYARAEAQVLIVLEYTALGWAALFGWLIFDESVRAEVLFGAAIIAAACVLATRGERIGPPVKETAV